MTAIKTGRSRTIWIWLLIIAAVLIAISDLLDAARYMGWLNTGMFDELEFVSPGIFWLGAFFSLILAAIWQRCEKDAAARWQGIRRHYSR